MISCSFLHMLNQKKYTDAAQIKKNQLKVYYYRTMKKKIKEFHEKEEKNITKQNNRCNCKNLNNTIKIQQYQSTNQHKRRVQRKGQTRGRKFTKIHQQQIKFQTKKYQENYPLLLFKNAGIMRRNFIKQKYSYLKGQRLQTQYSISNFNF